MELDGFDMNNVGMNIIEHLKFPKNFHGTLMKNEAYDIIDSALLSALSDQCKQRWWQSKYMMEVGDATQDGVLLQQLLFANDGQQQYSTQNGRQTSTLSYFLY
eukprot:12924032-Ditylum_brightwellii.AAC.1